MAVEAPAEGRIGLEVRGVRRVDEGAYDVVVLPDEGGCRAAPRLPVDWVVVPTSTRPVPLGPTPVDHPPCPVTVDAARTEAKAEAERILTAAKAEIQQEMARAKESLRDQVADLAVAGASKILKREVDAKAHADLLASIRREL